MKNYSVNMIVTDVEIVVKCTEVSFKGRIEKSAAYFEMSEKESIDVYLINWRVKSFQKNNPCT